MDRKLLQQLKDDNIDVDALGSNSRVQKKRWNDCVLDVLRSKVGQVLLCTLVVIDALVIVGEIVIEVRSLTRQLELRDAQVRKLAEYLLDSSSELRFSWNRTFPFILNQADEMLVLYEKLLESSAALPCLKGQSLALLRSNASDSDSDSESAAITSNGCAKRSRFPTNKTQPSVVNQYEKEVEPLLHAAHWMHLVSAVILFIFVVEVLLKLICLGFKRFFTDKLEIIDGSIIIISFLVDTITLMDSATNPGTSVMIILLLWRIIRLINGLMMHEKQRDELRIKILAQARATAVSNLQVVHGEKALMELQLAKCRELCRSLGATTAQLSICDEIARCIQDKAASDCKANSIASSRQKSSDGFLSKFSRKSAISINRSPSTPRSNHNGANVCQPCASVLVAGESSLSTPMLLEDISRPASDLKQLQLSVPTDSASASASATTLPIHPAEEDAHLEPIEFSVNPPTPAEEAAPVPVTPVCEAANGCCALVTVTPNTV